MRRQVSRYNFGADLYAALRYVSASQPLDTNPRQQSPYVRYVLYGDWCRGGGLSQGGCCCRRASAERGDLAGGSQHAQYATPPSLHANPCQNTVRDGCVWHVPQGGMRSMSTPPCKNTRWVCIYIRRGLEGGAWAIDSPFCKTPCSTIRACVRAACMVSHRKCLFA